MVSFIPNKEQIRVSSKTIFAGLRQMAGDRIRVDSDPIFEQDQIQLILGCNPLCLKSPTRSMDFSGCPPHDPPGEFRETV
jgi:hypothetical protein